MLRSDGLRRGPGCVHLKDHRKFGKHRTLLRVAFPLIEELVSLPEVKSISFGKIVLCAHTPHSSVTVRVTKARFSLIITNTRSLQFVVIYLRNDTAGCAQIVLGRIRDCAAEHALEVIVLTDP
jgi:hypothetical protein